MVRSFSTRAGDHARGRWFRNQPRPSSRRPRKSPRLAIQVAATAPFRAKQRNGARRCSGIWLAPPPITNPIVPVAAAVGRAKMPPPRLPAHPRRRVVDSDAHFDAQCTPAQTTLSGPWPGGRGAGTSGSHPRLPALRGRPRGEPTGRGALAKPNLRACRHTASAPSPHNGEVGDSSRPGAICYGSAGAIRGARGWRGAQPPIAAGRRRVG